MWFLKLVGNQDNKKVVWTQKAGKQRMRTGKASLHSFRHGDTKTLFL